MLCHRVTFPAVCLKMHEVRLRLGKKGMFCVINCARDCFIGWGLVCVREREFECMCVGVGKAQYIILFKQILSVSFWVDIARCQTVVMMLQAC